MRLFIAAMLFVAPAIALAIASVLLSVCGAPGAVRLYTASTRSTRSAPCARAPGLTVPTGQERTVIFSDTACRLAFMWCILVTYCRLRTSDLASTLTESWIHSHNTGVETDPAEVVAALEECEGLLWQACACAGVHDTSVGSAFRLRQGVRRTTTAMLLRFSADVQSCGARARVVRTANGRAVYRRTICPFLALRFISMMSLFSCICNELRSLSISRIDLSMRRLFSRKSSARRELGARARTSLCCGTSTAGSATSAQIACAASAG